MKGKYFLQMLLVFCVLVSGNVWPSTKKPVVLRLVCPAPEGDWPLYWKDAELVKRFNERAKGEYKIELHAGGALVKLPEYMDAVSKRVVEMADAPWGMFNFLERKLGLLDYPFLFDSMEAAILVRKELEKLYDDLMQKRFGVKAIGLLATGGNQLWSRKPIRTLEDWKGLMVGAIAPTHATLVKALGGSPVTIMWVELYEALMKKVVDAGMTSISNGVNFGFGDVCKYITLFSGTCTWNGYIINLRVWNEMPAHIQKILQEELEWAADWATETHRTKVFDNGMKYFKERGVTVYFLPKEEREKWVAKFRPFLEKEMKENGEFGLKVLELANKANAQARYSERALW